MNNELVARWEKNKGEIRKIFEAGHPSEYKEIVKAVVQSIGGEKYGPSPSLDPERIHVIDDGDYQGTLLFIIASKGYQPSEYWSVFVDYGSCSGCDTLQAIHDYSDKPPTEDQVNQYMTLALHVVQGLKEVGKN